MDRMGKGAEGGEGGGGGSGSEGGNSSGSGTGKDGSRGEHDGNIAGSTPAQTPTIATGTGDETKKRKRDDDDEPLGPHIDVRSEAELGEQLNPTILFGNMPHGFAEDGGFSWLAGKAAEVNGSYLQSLVGQRTRTAAYRRASRIALGRALEPCMAHGIIAALHKEVVDDRVISVDLGEGSHAPFDGFLVTVIAEDNVRMTMGMLVGAMSVLRTPPAIEDYLGFGEGLTGVMLADNEGNITHEVDFDGFIIKFRNEKRQTDFLVEHEQVWPRFKYGGPSKHGLTRVRQVAYGDERPQRRRAAAMFRSSEKSS